MLSNPSQFSGNATFHGNTERDVNLAIELAKLWGDADEFQLALLKRQITMQIYNNFLHYAIIFGLEDRDEFVQRMPDVLDKEEWKIRERTQELRDAYLGAASLPL